MTAITALAPWFGAKRNLAADIIAEIGDHSAYWEPFCGSMAVLLAKPPCPMETANDLHGDLINLARVLQDETSAEKLYDMLSRTLMHEQLFEAAADIVRSSELEGVERAYNYFLVSWMGRNGVSGTGSYNCGFCARYTSNGGHAAKRWRSAIESIPAWHDRLRNVTILHRDAFELLRRIEDKRGTVIYCDPPYLVKGAKYTHDLTNEQHAELALLLQRFKLTRVIVSYYEHPSLADLYPGWTMRRLKAIKALVNQGMRDKGGAVKAPEVLLINGPSFVDEAAVGLFQEVTQ